MHLYTLFNGKPSHALQLLTSLCLCGMAQLEFCWSPDVFRWSLCPCWHPGSLLTQQFVNHSDKFHRMYTFGALGNTDELTRFWSRKVKGQGRDVTHCGKSLLLGPSCHCGALNNDSLSWFEFVVGGLAIWENWDEGSRMAETSALKALCWVCKWFWSDVIVCCCHWRGKRRSIGDDLLSSDSKAIKMGNAEL